MTKLVAFGIVSVFAVPAVAGVSVRIADCPQQVLRYSPIFVTGELRNDGKEPILIPATNHTANRYFIETGESEDRLTEFSPYDTSGGGSVVSLAPGASWFFRQDLAPWINKAEPLFVRVGIQSSGECQYYANGSERFPLHVIEKRPGYETYACWQGRTQSTIARIDVIEPTSAADLAALDYLRSPEFPGGHDMDSDLKYRLRLGFGALFERFPMSHYAYVGGFYACDHAPACLQKLLDAQPANPLNPYTSLQKGLAVLEAGRSNALTASEVEALHLPAVLSDYLLQEKRRLGAASLPVGPGKTIPGMVK